MNESEWIISPEVMKENHIKGLKRDKIEAERRELEEVFKKIEIEEEIYGKLAYIGVGAFFALCIVNLFM